MKFAKKLDYVIDTTPLLNSSITPHQKYGTSLSKLQRYAKKTVGDFVGSETKKISNEEEFISQLPKKLVEAEKPYVFLLEIESLNHKNPVLPIHIDFKKTCGINVYLEASGEITKFYNWNKETKESEYAEEFCAKTGEVWLMNTCSPHSVTMVPGKNRRILTFSFTKLNYDGVLECFLKK